MACTTQSALDYVKQARVQLVGELKSLSVIVENLYQRKVLTDEEVSKIQAETDDYDKTRHILTLVIKKGEAACYEFLRIIDMTRGRTLGRPPLPPEKKSGASSETKTFDLHHWISCYPFKEDTQMDMNYLQGPRPCYRYQAKLKIKAERISNEFWKENKDLFEGSNKPDLSYTSLVLNTQGNVSPSKIKKLKSKKSKMSRPKKLRTYIPEDKPEISPSDLLKTDKSTVLVGKPGIGKTALTQEMLKLWAERDSKELDYMFYFGMRETSQFTINMSLEDLLFNVFSEPVTGKEEVLDDIKNNSENVTVIFDGITDLSSSVVRRLVEKDLLPDAKIIITCRPDDEELFSGDFLRVEVKGFSEQSIKTYLSATLGEEQKKVLSNLELLSLCHVPMYALMVAACFSSGDSPQPCTITEVYINIVRFCLKMNSNKTKKRDLNSFITNKGKEILSLAQVAFDATEGKTVNLTDLACKDSCVLSFLKPLVIKVALTERDTTYAFLHYTMQEFFAALWLLKNPEKVKDVFQQCLTEEKKHMRHLIPFMCRLLNEKKPSLMKCLIPAEELKNTPIWFCKEVITTFFQCLCERDESDTEDSGSDVDILFLCQCLYESQCPEACIYLLDKLDYCLDLSEQSLDPYSCCAVAYVVAQSKEKKIQLNLEDVMVSERGMRRLFGCLTNVQWCDPLPRQMWKIFLLSEGQMDHVSLLSLDGNQLHLPVEGKRQLFERAVKVMQKITMKVNVCLYWDRVTSVSPSLCESLLEALPYISSLSFRTTYRGLGLQDQDQCHGKLRREEKGLLLDLCLKAALHKGDIFQSVVNVLFSLFSVNTDLNNIHLDFYQHVKSKGCSSVNQQLRSLFQSAPPVWIIDLSKRKTSILLEVLKLKSEKKQVELTDWSDEESEVRSFLECVPYISQLSFVPRSSDHSEETRFFVNLLCAAAEREQQTGEKILEMLSSVCRYNTFPLKQKWCHFFLDLFSYDTEKDLSVLPALQSVFQSVPVWIIDLSERKTSILLEVLKLQPEKKQVELTDWSDEESEVRSFLQCVPYISQLSCRPQFFQSVCTSISVKSRKEVKQLASLLKLLGFTLHLTGELGRKTCRTVGKVLGLCASNVDLILTPTKVSVRGAALLFRSSTQLHSLRLSNHTALLLFGCVRRGRMVCPLVLEDLSLAPETVQPPERELLKVVRRLASLLRYWEVHRLDLTEFCVPARCVVTLLLHNGPLRIKLSAETFQQLPALLHEIQDQDLTLSSLTKVGGDLTSCCLDWEVLHYLLQQVPAQTITVNLRKHHFIQENITRLIPFLDRILFKRSSPGFVLTAIRETYRAHASHIVPSLLRSFDHVINLTCRELDSVDCAAVCFTLTHSDRVNLKLLWTSIPAGEIQSILFTLDKVSQLSVDRNLLLRLIHCCAACDVQQEAASGLFRVTQHRLDLSCSSCVDLREEGQTETLCLTAGDCRAISTILRHSSQDTQLDLRDCEVEDRGLELLFPVLDRVCFRASKAVLLQLLSLVSVNTERDTVRRAVSLCRALGGGLDLSHTTLDERACGALAVTLDLSEGLTELDLSHCQITDQLLLTLITHLHKVQALDLSHNNITDVSTDKLLQLLSINPSMDTVRLFGNNIVDRTAFKKDKRFEIW
uniref:Si:ch211-108d22.2 n=1 Tax=Seriola dumerili TaxID=41447 RepID=A0A3B4VEW5_SERDU